MRIYNIGFYDGTYECNLDIIHIDNHCLIEDRYDDSLKDYFYQIDNLRYNNEKHTTIGWIDIAIDLLFEAKIVPAVNDIIIWNIDGHIEQCHIIAKYDLM